MRIKDAVAEAEEPYNLVPLTDMVFNLLIFFMCATTFAQIEKDMSVQLPRVQQAQFNTLSTVPRQLVVNIEQDGTIVVNMHKIDLAGLKNMVADAVRSDANAEVDVRADDNSRMHSFNAVTEICRQAGVPALKYNCIPQQ